MDRVPYGGVALGVRSYAGSKGNPRCPPGDQLSDWERKGCRLRPVMAASSNLQKVILTFILPYMHFIDCTRAPEAYMSSVLSI